MHELLYKNYLKKYLATFYSDNLTKQAQRLKGRIRGKRAVQGNKKKKTK